jgi:FkbM family methyltransferase
MSFISYAQNYEDVMLWRALGHVENGFYIDIGASDPEQDSVTKAFYDRGWHGINLEPVSGYHQRLIAERPRDINLAVAAGDHNGELTLFDIPSVRGWASPERAVADHYRNNGFEIRELKVPVRTLASVCEEHVKGDIHFLKIDVECFEADVLRGMDFGRWRPWILVIEATVPNSEVPNHEAWETMLTGQGYRYAYFDGLNRYYVASEHAGLAQALSTPPNVFDDFQTAAQAKALRAEQLAEKRAQGAEAAAQHLQAQVNSLQRQLQDVYESASWKISAPLRKARGLFIAIKEIAHRPRRSPRALARRYAGSLLRRAVPLVRRSPLLTRWAWRIYARFPVLGQRMLGHARASGWAAPPGQTLMVIPDAPCAWTPSAAMNDHFKTMLTRELQRRRTEGMQ